MKLHIAAVGRPKTWAQAALEHYEKFLRKYGGVEFHFVAAMRAGDRPDVERVRAVETTRLLAALPKRATRVFIDRTGRAFMSEQWAANLDRLLRQSTGPVAFLIGGPLGFDLTQWAKADEVWSLSSLTFPHELALIILCEQLARGFSILRGDGYHK